MVNKLTSLSYCLLKASNLLYKLDSVAKQNNNTFSNSDSIKEIVNSGIDSSVRNKFDKELLKALNNMLY